MTNLLNKQNIIKTTIFLVIILAIFITILTIFFAKQPVNEKSDVQVKKYLTENPNLPKTQWLRKIQIEKTKNIQIITNPYDGYQITVPATWDVEEIVRGGAGGLMVQYEHNINDVAHAETGMVLRVYMFYNPSKLSLIDWLTQSSEAKGYFKNVKFEKVQLNSDEAFKTSEQITNEIYKNNKIIDVPQPNTLNVRYLLRNKNADNIYVISCVAFNDADTLIPICEKQIQTFKIL